MVAFLETIYRTVSGEPFHLVVDEADLFAPQKPQKGDETLLGHMENIVRRGRVKGFIPWLISQRPAVLNKNVLSQVDGLLAFSLTASQDRDALDAWIEGQADKDQGKAIKAALPTLQVGQGVVWLPRHGILKTAAFPRKVTFDSSRQPKRGEKKRTAALRPLDLASLKQRLSTVESEAKANDPKALKAEIADLRRKLANAPAGQTAPDPQAIAAAEQRGEQRGHARGFYEGREFVARTAKENLTGWFRGVQEGMSATIAGIDDLGRQEPLSAARPSTRPILQPPPAPHKANGSHAAVPRPVAAPKGDGTLTGPQRELLRALAWWNHMGDAAPTRAQVAAIAGWRITSGHLRNIASSLSTAGLITYPESGRLALTGEGMKVTPEPDVGATVIGGIRQNLSGPQRQVFDLLLQARTPLPRETVAEQLGWAPTSGHLRNIASSLSTLELVEYPSPGTIGLRDWVLAA
jgi:hypothetical protein